MTYSPMRFPSHDRSHSGDMVCGRTWKRDKDGYPLPGQLEVHECTVLWVSWAEPGGAGWRMLPFVQHEDGQLQHLGVQYAGNDGDGVQGWASASYPQGGNRLHPHRSKRFMAQVRRQLRRKKK